MDDVSSEVWHKSLTYLLSCGMINFRDSKGCQIVESMYTCVVFVKLVHKHARVYLLHK